MLKQVERPAFFFTLIQGCTTVDTKLLAMLGKGAEKIAKDRCWKGYKPVKGKKPYSDDSCEPVGGAEKKEALRKGAEHILLNKEASIALGLNAALQSLTSKNNAPNQTPPGDQ